MNKDALRKFYESLLPILGLEIGSDDFLNTFSINQENEKEFCPMMVNNLPVIFPTDSVLREGKWKDRVGFHPLSESVTRGISPVMVSMSTAMKFKFFQSIFYIGVALINVAKESREGTLKNLPAKLVEALGKLPKTVDAKTLAFFSKVITASNETDQAVLKVCIKRNGSILGTDYKRTASIYFPIYEQLVEAIAEKKTEFWGVTAARKTDLVVVKELLEIILPDIDDENRYAVGTFASTAPYLDALMRAAIKVQDSMNNAMELLDKHMPASLRSAFHASTDWIEETEDLGSLRNVIPPLRFNEGEITEEEEKQRETDTRPVRPMKAERSSEIPDFSAKANNAMKRASEAKGPPQKFGRRYIDNSLTEEERRNPEKAERRMSSQYEDDYENDRGYGDRGRSSSYRERNSRRRDDDRGWRDRDSRRGGRGRGRDDYDDYDDDRGSSWANRERSRGRDRGGRDSGRDRGRYGRGGRY